MSDIFKAIADPTRREILLMVAKEPTNINTIAKKFNMSRPAVSKHIKILNENDLVYTASNSDDGRQRYCYAQLEALREVNDYLNLLEKFWIKKLDGLGNYLDKQAKGKKT